MKMTASSNIRNGTFKQISHHVNRTFENKNYGTLNDKNINHIDPELSYLNLSSDGAYKNFHGQLVFIYNKQKERSSEKNLENIINSKYNGYIQNHNNKKSVKHNKKRCIHNLFKEKLLKGLPKKQRNYDKQNYLDKYERLLIQNCGNSEENLKNIKLIQKYQIKNHRHMTFQYANRKYRKAVSIALYIYARHFDRINPNLKIINYCSNVDENSNKTKDLPDALHIHTSILGLTSTKNGRPSFSVARAICHQEHVKYNYAITKIHGKNVNNSLHKAMKKFRIRNGTIFLKSFLQPTLSIVFPKVKQFRNINYYQTGQRINGLSMNEERLRQNAKTLSHQLKKRLSKKEQKLDKRHKHQSYLDRKNGAKRARNIRKYKAKCRYLTKRRKAIKSYHKQTNKWQRINTQKWKKNLLKSENLSIKIKSQHRIIINNQIKINKQQSKLQKIKKLIHQKENELKNFANNLIQAFKQTIKQNNMANNYNIRAISNANNRLEKSEVKQAHNGIFSRLRATFSDFHSNYSISANQSNFSKLLNTYNSISSASSYSNALPSLRASKRSKSTSISKNMKKIRKNKIKELKSIPNQTTVSTPTWVNGRGWER